MSHRGVEELLEPFTHALESKRALDIPQETLLGAVTHFLSTLPHADLPRLVEAVVGSDYLWLSDDYAGYELGQAISLAVTAKVDYLGKRHLSSWCASRKASSSSRQWLNTVQTTLGKFRAQGVTGLEIRAGLLAGVAQNDQIQWEDERVKLEEDVILGVSQSGLSISGTRELAIICEAVNHVDARRLLILDLQSLVPFLQDSLLASLDNSPAGKTRPSKLSVALGRLFEVLSEGSRGDRAFLRDSVHRFVGVMRQRGEIKETPSSETGMASDEEWNKQKTVLFAFLVPTSKIIDILLRDLAQPQASSFDKASTSELCIKIIATLAAFSHITQQSEGGLESHDRVLFGALDIVVDADGNKGSKRLFRELTREEVSQSRAAFMMQCGEQLVDDLDSSTLTNTLLPLAQSYLTQPQAKAPLEAAHAFILAVITSTAESDDRPLPQAAFAEEIVIYYSDLLVKHLMQGDISVDQFRSSYVVTVDLASKVSDDLTLGCISQLGESAESAREHKHILMLTRVSTAQFVPIAKLRSYLDEVAVDIAKTPAGDKRLDLAASAFGMVVRELGDEQKKIGIDWWLERKGQIEGKNHAKRIPHISAKL